MKIKFVKREVVINKILDDLNNSKDKKISDELKRLLTDLSK